MRRTARGAAWAAFAFLACATGGPGRAGQEKPPDRATPGQGRAAEPAPPVPAPPAPAPLAPASSTPAAGPTGQPCGAKAASYGDGRAFDLAVTRAGQVRTENPLRPLTPEVNQVLQVVISGKVATAYGSDFATLRRGGTPAAVEAMLGGPIRWQAELPMLPDPIAIFTENGAPLAELAFRACEAPPAIKAPPQAKQGPTRGKDGQAKAARKTPPGFSMPQGAIAE